MSRIGKNPIQLPKEVELNQKGGVVSVKGPLGTLDLRLAPEIKLKISKGVAVVAKAVDTRRAQQLYGLSRTLVQNMVDGVTKGFEKTLDIQGVGYRAEKQDRMLVVNVGFSNPVHFPLEDGIDAEVPNPTRIVIKGIDKQRVGEIAAQIRRLRPPEPYKGKGIRYLGELVRRKAGKTAIG